MITSIAFTLSAVSDLARARRFYEHVLGLRLSHNFRVEWTEFNKEGRRTCQKNLPSLRAQRTLI
jgi:catechol 2,3-dioxygenase-like lactoylglutathione lyase family enzyme